MFYKIWCKPMHPLHGALHVPYVSVRVGLLAVLWLHIGGVMSLFASEPLSTVGLLLHSQYLCGTILLTRYSMVWDRRQLAYAARPLFVFYCFPFLYFLSMGWYCEARVFGLIGCESLSSSVSLLPFLMIMMIIIIIIIIIKYV